MQYGMYFVLSNSKNQLSENKKKGRKRTRHEEEEKVKKRECALWYVFVLSSSQVKKTMKKRREEKLDFHRFQVRHFSVCSWFEHFPCYCKMGQRQRADLSVFGRTKFITRRNISV